MAKNDNAADYQLNADKAAKEIENLKNQVSQLKSELGGLERNTDAYNSKLQELTNTSRKQYSANQGISDQNSGFISQFENVNTVVGYLSSGFEAYMNIAKLTGNQNENLSRTFTQLQTIAGLAQSFVGLSKGLKGVQLAVSALGSGPIGLIVGGFTALAATAKILAPLLSQQVESVKELKRVSDAYNLSLKLQDEVLDETIFKIRLEGGTQQDVALAVRKHNYKRIQSTEELTDSLREQIKAEEDLHKEAMKSPQTTGMYRQYDYSHLHNAEELKRQLDKREEQLEDYYAKQKLLNDEALRLDREQQIEEADRKREGQKAANEQAKRDAEQAYKERIEKEKAHNVQMEEVRENIRQEWRDKQKAHNDEVARNMKETYIKIISDAQDEFENMEDIEIPFIESFREWSSIEAMEERRNAYKQEIENLWELANASQETDEIKAEARRKLERVQKNFNAFEVKAQKSKEEVLAKEKKARESLYSSTTSILNSTSKLIGENTAAGKAAAIASATVQTYQSAQSAYASQLIPGDPTSIFRANLARAAAIIAGIANVKKIMEVNTPGSSGGATPSVSAMPTMPTLTAPIQETHNTMDAYDEEFYNQSQRVYVTESDITSIQNKVRVVETKASFP